MEADHLPATNYSKATNAILSVNLILTTVAVVGRTASRRMMKAPLSADDFFTSIAFFCNLGLLVSGFVLTTYGAVNSSIIEILTSVDEHEMLVAYFALATLYVLSITAVKLSILFLYRRMFTLHETWFRKAWWGLFYLTLVWFVACIVLLALQGVNTLPKTGFSRLGIGITGLVNAFSDVLMLSLPAVMIMTLNIHQKQKIALMSVFGIGIIALIVSIIRSAIFLVDSGHLLVEAYSSYLDIVTTATESSAGLMCACLPLTKPLIKGFSQWSQKIRGRSTENHGWTTISDSQTHSFKEKDRKQQVATPDIHMVPMQSAYLKPDQETINSNKPSPILQQAAFPKPYPMKSAFD